EKGSLTLIAGKNGSGKSMLLKCLKGLEKPDGGRITIDGRELKRERERMRAFGLVFQDTSLEIVGSTVRKDIAFGLENLRWERKRIQETTDRMVSLFNLEKIQNLPPSVLSGGEKRRLSIAGVLAMEPDIILMDEPLANLDYPSIKMVLSTLLELKEKGITIIIVSHEAEKLLSLTDNTIILSEGKIVNMGRSRDMMDALRNNEVYLPPKANFEDLSWLK
ncbi:MAG: energy-coupling factor ABC transporter ATP-binding protein, partial [Candidatus Ornithospirochaeta sp.]